MKLDLNGVSVHNSVFESRQFPYNRAKMSGKILNRFQSKFILCKNDNL